MSITFYVAFTLAIVLLGLIAWHCIQITIANLGDPCEFRNYYACDTCNTSWNDDWDSMCNDRCTVCNKEIEPYYSEVLTYAQD